MFVCVVLCSYHQINFSAYVTNDLSSEIQMKWKYNAVTLFLAMLAQVLFATRDGVGGCLGVGGG